MCYKNFAPMGLKYNIHTSLQEFRSAAADSNTKCLLVAVLLFCLSAPKERYSGRKYVCIVFEPQRGDILVENTCVLYLSPSGATFL